MKTSGKEGAAFSTHVRLVEIVPVPVKLETGRSASVRKLPKYPFLLAVQAPGEICESPFTDIFYCLLLLLIVLAECFSHLNPVNIKFHKQEWYPEKLKSGQLIWRFFRVIYHAKDESV